MKTIANESAKLCARSWQIWESSHEPPARMNRPQKLIGSINKAMMPVDISEAETPPPPKREKRGRPSRALGDRRREIFCVHVASGVPVAEAYTLAGYEPNP